MSDSGQFSELNEPGTGDPSHRTSPHIRDTGQSQVDMSGPDTATERLSPGERSRRIRNLETEIESLKANQSDTDLQAQIRDLEERVLRLEEFLSSFANQLTRRTTTGDETNTGNPVVSDEGLKVIYTSVMMTGAVLSAFAALVSLLSGSIVFTGAFVLASIFFVYASKYGVEDAA